MSFGAKHRLKSTKRKAIYCFCSNFTLLPAKEKNRNWVKTKLEQICRLDHLHIRQTGWYQCYRTFHALSRAVRSGMIRSIIAGSKWSVRQKWATSPLSEMWLIEDHQLWTRYQQQNVQNKPGKKSSTFCKVHSSVV